MSFRVMSFNIRGSFRSSDGQNNWDRRAALNVATIQKYAPDLIGFQELQDGNLSVYRAELPDYQYIVGHDASGPPPEHQSMFWKPSIFTLLDSGAFWISETPEVHSGSWETDCVRAATWVRLREQTSGTEFIHLNTHLDHRSAWARREGCRLIVRRLADLRQDGTLPAILTGDFNANAHQRAEFADEIYRYLRDQGFVDSYLAAGNSDAERSHTFHGFQGERFAPDRPGNAGRIDWLLTLDGAQAWRVLASGIIRDHAAPVYPSDHYPIFADLTFA